MTAIAVLLLNVAGFGFADTRTAKAKKRAAAKLVAMLPASDAVAVFDSKRFFENSLPQILSANQPVLGEVMARVADMEKRTGIDLRKFDQFAIGATAARTEKGMKFDAIAIASGEVSAGALVAVARLASKGSYREEKIGDKTLYVFAVKDVVQKNAPKAGTNSKVIKVINDVLDAKEIAVTALDRSTIAIGSLERVREAIQGTSRVSPEITNLLSVKETAVVSFAMQTPDGMGSLLPLDNDELGKAIGSIQFLSGSVDVASTGTSLDVAARTQKPDQAAALKDTLDGLQMVGKAVFGASKNADRQMYARLIGGAKIAAHGSDVTLNITVPQSDIDILVASIK